MDMLIIQIAIGIFLGYMLIQNYKAVSDLLSFIGIGIIVLVLYLLIPTIVTICVLWFGNERSGEAVFGWTLVVQTGLILSMSERVRKLWNYLKNSKFGLLIKISYYSSAYIFFVLAAALFGAIAITLLFTSVIIAADLTKTGDVQTIGTFTSAAIGAVVGGYIMHRRVFGRANEKMTVLEDKNKIS